MAQFLRRLKRKYWDGVPRFADSNQLIHMGEHKPWLRRFWEGHRQDIRKGFWPAFFTVLAAVIIKVL